MTDAIYTIGHSTHSLQELIALLSGQGITAVCDVRSRPYSRMNPQFNREPLKQALRAVNIEYVFLGKELGARSEDKDCYRDGRVQFDLLAQSSLFRHGLARVKDGARSYRVVLMCAEKEPLECHRTILVARRLFEDGVPIKHILGDGRLEDHEHAIARLISKLKIPEDDMFRSNDAIVSEAYTRQGNEIAFREQEPNTLDSGRMPRQRARGAAE